VVGGGFAGLYGAAYLARSEIGERASITLVDPKNYFTFTPLIPEVAAGTLGREHVAYPYRALARQYGIEFVQDAAEGIDLGAKVLTTAHQTQIPFDYLLLAPGAEPKYFGNESLRQWSVPLTSVPEALTIRDRVIQALEQASVATDPAERRRLTTFVVAGAGPAGVEIASEIRHLANEVLRPYYESVLPARVILMDPSDRILNGFDAGLAAAGLDRIRQRGVEVCLGARIVQAAPGLVTWRHGDTTEALPAGLFVWTAGTGPVAWVSSLGLPTERGALVVTPTLQVQGQECIFAVGDVTTLVDPRTNAPYPRVAPIAISQGVRAAANIENHALGRPLEPYRAYHAGKIVSLGDGAALVDLLGTRLTGRVAWWIYRATYILKLVGIRNKVQVLTTLALQRFFGPDISGEPAPEGRTLSGE
jgi:NADH dehydrogenase